MKKPRVFGWNGFLAIAALCLITPGARAADVEFYGVVKMQRFEQSNPTAPELVDFEDLEPGEEPPFVLDTFVDLTSSNAVTSATLTIPGGAVRALTLEDDGFNRNFSDGTEFKPDLDLVYSNATYTLSLQTQNDGSKSLPLTFPPADAYPNPPRISNFTAAQSINPAADFTVTWDAFTGGLVTDFVQFEIVESATDTAVFETAGPGEPDSLNGTSTAVLIPGGTLSAGRSYRGRIFFAKIVGSDDMNYAGVTGVAAFLVETIFPVQTTGGADNSAPMLESQTPFNMQIDVGTRAVVSFKFNERMNTALSLGSSIAWSNVNAGLFNYTWSADSRTLFCVYPPGFPTNTLIAWQLNPAGSPENLRDVAGNKLPAQGASFNTGSENGPGQNDVDFLSLVKGRVFRQAGSVPESVELHQFGMTSDLNTLNGVTNGLVTLPNTRTVTPELDFGDAFDFEALYSSQAQLDSFFPDGSYQARFDTVHDGTRTFNLTLSGSTYPNAPQVLNFAITQSANPTNAFVLSWGAFAGGTASDFISLEIQSQDDFSSGDVFETPNFNEAGALNGTNTSVTIPAFTLAPGRTYSCELLFVKVAQVDTNTYPGTTAVAGYFSATFFELRTIGQPIQPSLRISVSSNTARVTVTGERNHFYTVESADSLAGNPTQWQTRVSRTANTNVNGFYGSFQFDDAALATGGKRFYRAREGGGFGGGP